MGTILIIIVVICCSAVAAVTMLIAAMAAPAWAAFLASSLSSRIAVALWRPRRCWEDLTSLRRSGR